MNALLRSRFTKIVAALVILNEIRGVVVVGGLLWAWLK